MKNLITLSIITLFLLNLSAFAQNTKSDNDQMESFRQLKAKMLSQEEDDNFQRHQNFKSQDGVFGDFGEAPEVDWLTKFGGTGTDKARKVVADETGNLYVIGDFAGIMEFAGQTLSSVGKRDVFIAKMDNSGNVLWIKQGNSGENNSSALYEVEITDTELIITGYFDGSGFSMDGSTVVLTGTSDALLMKVAFDGQINLLKNIGQSGFLYQGLALAIDSDQNIYLTGTLNGNPSWAQSSFLTKLDQSGNPLWWQEHNIAFNDVVVSGDALYVAGTAHEDAWLGDIFLDPFIYADAFVSKADFAGNYEWAIIGEHIQSPIGDSYNPQIEIGETGDVFMTGYFRRNVEFGGILLGVGSTDAFIVRINSQGEVAWAKSTNGTQKELNGFALLENDQPCISGGMDSWATFDDIEVYGNTGFYAAIYDSSGAAQHAFTVNQEVLGILSGSENGFIMAGITSMNASLIQYNFAGTSQSIVTSQGNSGTSQLTGLEVNGDGMTFALSNILGYTNYFGLEFTSPKQAMLLAGQKPDGEVQWISTIEGGTARWSYTETNLKIDDAHKQLYLHGSYEDTLKIGGLELVALFRSSFLASYIDNGEFLWIEEFPYSSIEIQSVDVDPQGNVYCAFTFGGTIQIGGESFTTYGNSSGNALLVKYSMDGDFISAKQFKTEYFFYQVGVAVVPSGGYFVTLEPAGDTVFFNNGNNNIGLTPNDGRCIVAKYDEQDNYLWAKSFGYSPINYGGYYCWPTASVSDAEGNLYLTGTHGDSAMFDNIMLRTPYNKYSPFNAKIDGDGNTLWANSIQSHRWGNNYGEADIDSEGNFYVMGDIVDTIHFGDWQYIPSGARDMYVAKYTNDGEVSWVKTFESTSSGNHLYGISVFDENNVFVGGNFANTIQSDDENILKTSSSRAGLMCHIGDSIAYADVRENTEQSVYVVVYPNPASEELYLNFKAPFQKTEIEIFDLNGRKILSQSLKEVSGTQRIDLPILPAGAYMMTISADGQTATRKILIK